MTVGVADLSLVLPFHQQQYFTSNLKIHAEYGTDVLSYHHQDKVGPAEFPWRQLDGLILIGGVTVVLEYSAR